MTTDTDDDPLWRRDEDRWVTERVRYLTANWVGLREPVARAAAYSELGYSNSGIAKRTNTTESTADKRLSQAEQQYPGIRVQLATDFNGKTDGRVDNASHQSPDRECPVCLKDRLCTTAEAQRVYRTSDWGATSMLDDADLVCSYCHSVRIDGHWERMETIGSRAYTLADANDNYDKDRQHYRDILTRGIETGKPAPTADDAEGW